MALIKDDQRVRLDIPHEAGEWIEIRPMRNSDTKIVTEAVDRPTMIQALFERLIIAWSYGEPVTPENIATLDISTTKWLDEQIPLASGLRTEPEKNGSTPSS